MFRSVKQNRAFEDIVSQVQESILEGEIRLGDKLPGERNLREIFSVSRGTLREALRVLEQKRLISIKAGVSGGAFVCEVGTRQMSDSLDFLVKYQKASVKELAEFREEVEGVVAEKAVKKAKEVDIEKLKSFTKTIKHYLDNDNKWIEIKDEGVKFHQYLAHIAGNIVYASVLDTIYENLNKNFDKFLPFEKKKGKEPIRICVKLLNLSNRETVRTLKFLSRSMLGRLAE